MKKGDIGCIHEVLGFAAECVRDDEDGFLVEKAQEAFIRIKKELNALRKENKVLRSAASTTAK